MDQTESIRQQIKKLSEEIRQSPTDVNLLCRRARLYEKLQDYGAALNDYNEVLRKQPHHKKAGAKAEMIKETLYYQNIDIYAATNLNKDPWEE